ncbi:MAG: lipopolysaccharide biosynthesis protein [Burkholderiales bacterium]|nr:lipopolysaccharide biosynthesis protein [Burkholderiales bacterium]
MARDDDLDDDEGLSLLDLAIPLAEHWKLLVIGPLLAGLVALGITYLIAPTFTARTVFLPPQQQQSAAASALSSLGALSGLVGAAANIKSPADQYVALMESATVSDHIIDRFGLMKVYDDKYRFEARKDLAKNVQISIGKKDGLISVEVDDHSPQRAADMANRYVDELRDMTSHLALTEAQQRRVFFEAQLRQTRDRLTQAQQALQASGFNPGALKAEPKAAADSYARMRAEVTAAEVRLQTMRRSLADTSPEVQQQLAQLDALRAQLGKVEATTPSDGGPDYISKYRQFKYEETLFDLFSRQYEMAKLDESREGSLIQVVDAAMPPEHKSKPKRAIVAVGSIIGSFFLLALFVWIRQSWRRARATPETAEKVAQLRAAMSRPR